jgi:hypothetical protein
MDEMAEKTELEFGDRVRHRKRPEWGVGSVIRVEAMPNNGQPGRRVQVRFPNGGLRTLSAAHADLERVVELEASPDTDDDTSVADWDKVGQTDWLAPVAQKKIEEMMITLPMEARDPFNGLRERLQFTLDLYRFDNSGKGLIDWAVAQSGLDDPLTRFSRQELEQHFDRWSFERDTHLRRLLQETDRGTVAKLMERAPVTARDAVQRVTNGR